jgi:hypothetical protein
MQEQAKRTPAGKSALPEAFAEIKLGDRLKADCMTSSNARMSSSKSPADFLACLIVTL